MKKIKKNQYLAGFAIIVAFLAVLRLVFPSIAQDRLMAEPVAINEVRPAEDTLSIVAASSNNEKRSGQQETDDSLNTCHLSPAAPHPIVSVASYADAFPDSNYVQMQSAQHWGVTPVSNRQDAEARKNELVYVGASPFYHVDPMKQSIPYLVPRAAVLLHDIGRCFYDSLQLKGVPIHQMIVTSVLRTREDVERLRNYNKNATENSCHLYGTTFDIAYNRYVTVQAPGEQRHVVPSDTLKWVLSEVLNDMRLGGRCYVKYEVKQGCFHITTR